MRVRRWTMQTGAGMRGWRVARVVLAGVALFCLAAPAASAQGRPYSLDDLTLMLRRGVRPQRVVQLARRDCLAFRMSAAAASRLQAAGAPADVVAHLRAACVKTPAAPARGRAAARRAAARSRRAGAVPDPATSRRRTTARVRTPQTQSDGAIAERPNRRRDTAVVATPVPTTPVRPPRSPVGRALIDDDFEGSQTMPTADGAECAYAYSGGGYVITNRREVGACEARYPVTLPANVRIETSVTMLDGGANTPVFIGFGKPADQSAGYYRLVIDNARGFRLTRLTSDGAVDLLPWRDVAALRPGLNLANRLAVEVRGQEITLFANGELLARYEALDGPPAGEVVLGTGVGSMVMFHYLRAGELR